VHRPAEQLGINSLSRSQVSEMATHLDAQVSAFRERPLDAGPYTFVWVDALTVKVREDGRVVNVHALIATGVNSDGHREILGLDVASGEDGAGWLAFLRGLVGNRSPLNEERQTGCGAPARQRAPRGPAQQRTSGSRR
jgi:putative transposase